MKNLILKELNSVLNEKIVLLKKAIDQAVESRDLETKSSAGDKHETSRAIIQREIDQLASQLKKNETLKHQLTKVDLFKNHQLIDFGSIVETNNGTYFLAIGWGKITISNKAVFCISLASPIGKQLYKKETGDQFDFQKKKFIVKNVI